MNEKQDILMLGPTGKRILKALHISLVSLWVGGLVSLVVLHSFKTGIRDWEQLSAASRSIFQVHEYIVVYATLGVIFTGFLFSLFTKSGFFRYYWVMVKWLAVLALYVLITCYLSPSINGMAAITDVKGASAFADPAYLRYDKSFPLLAWSELIILLALILLSTLKPWGEVKRKFSVSRKRLVMFAGLASLGVMSGIVTLMLQFHSYRAMPVTDVRFSAAPDGVYQGEARCGFSYEVSVSIEKGAVKDIKVLKNYDSEYARLAEGIVSKILKAQRLNVDAVTGATTTSKCLMKAVENAVKEVIQSGVR